ncbi:MAG: TlpA disulfide reductase family protein [Bacteroidota bacterium]
MKIKQITILLLLLCPVLGFSQLADYTIKGKVNSRYNGSFIKLYYTPDNAPKKTIDSVKINNGTFLFNGKIERPTLAKVTLGNEDKGDRIDFFMAPGLTNVVAKDSIKRALISGNKLAASYEKLAIGLRPLDNKMFGGLAAYQSMPEGEAKKAYVTNLLAGLDEYSKNKREVIRKFVSENPDSYVSLYFLDKNSPGTLLNYEATYPSYAKLSSAMKETVLGKELEARLGKAKGALTGEQFKDFVSTTPEGKELSLKEVVGNNKYTLVDFWASWCGPCRKENPNVVKTFNDFKGKGFTVLSVSLDDDAAKWKAAIEKDGMPWYHVSSLKGWKEPAATLYNIRAIPQNVLVDSKGKIVATNLRAETLYSKVQSLLN